MRILIYGLNFSPELTGIGKYTGEMAQWLAERGHEVRVITAPPYYPDWAVHAGYRSGTYACEVWRGVKVIRCPLWVPRRVSGIKRLVHLASFALSSLPVAVFQLKWRPDVVWTVQPALFAAPGALLLAKLAGARSWLHVQDYEVDAAFAMGLLRGKRLLEFVSAIEAWLMRSFDTVSTISGKMLDLAHDKGVDRNRLVHFPNWADISGIFPLTERSSYRGELGIDDRTMVVLYSGNMGAKQGLQILAEAARELAGRTDILFVLCGQGVGKEELMHLCLGLDNVRFLPLQPKDRFNELLGMADLHVLPQRADAADLVLPSKLTGMFASGRPVVATAARGTGLAQIIVQAGAGELVAPEDGKDLARVISDLAAKPELRRAMGRAARVYAELEFDANVILERFEEDLASVK